MPDPLSITTGVLAILGVCAKVGWQLNQFQDAAKVVDTTVEALKDDVNGIVRVLNALQETIRVSRASAFQETGHIGTHWRNLSTSISDGKDVLDNLESLLEHVAKKTTLLNRPRMQLRYQLAEDQLAVLQLRLKSWRDTIQLSLCIVILWRQGEEAESQSNMNLSLKVFDSNIRRLADTFSQQIQKLEGTPARGHEEELDLRITTNLRECVRSAASVMSSASTAQGFTDDDQSTIYASSDFEDCLPSGSRLDIQRWIDARTEYEYSVKDDHELCEQHSNSVGGPGSDTETESELETDLMRILLTRGRELHAAGDLIAAQRSLENCVSRSDTIVAQTRLQSTSEVIQFRGSALQLLTKIHVHHSRWSDAQECLEKRLKCHGKAASDEGIEDMETLVAVHLQQQHYGDAHRYARKVLMAYRKNEGCNPSSIADTLRLLITISKQQANPQQEEAYLAMLLHMGQEFEPVVESTGIVGFAAPPKPQRRPPPPPSGLIQPFPGPSAIELRAHGIETLKQEVETEMSSDLANVQATRPATFTGQGNFEVQSDVALSILEVLAEKATPEPRAVDSLPIAETARVAMCPVSPEAPAYDAVVAAISPAPGSDCSNQTTHVANQSGLNYEHRSNYYDSFDPRSSSVDASRRLLSTSSKRKSAIGVEDFEHREESMGNASGSEMLTEVSTNGTQEHVIGQYQAHDSVTVNRHEDRGSDYAEDHNPVSAQYHIPSTEYPKRSITSKPSTTPTRSQLGNLTRIDIPAVREAASNQNHLTTPSRPSSAGASMAPTSPSTPTTIVTQAEPSETHSSRGSDVFTPVTEKTYTTAPTEVTHVNAEETEETEEKAADSGTIPVISFGHVRRRLPQVARFNRFVSTKISGSRDTNHIQEAGLDTATKPQRSSVQLFRPNMLHDQDNLSPSSEDLPTKRPRSASATLSVPTLGFQGRIVPLDQQRNSHDVSSNDPPTDHSRIPAISRSVCCIGDGNSGKTGLLQRAATGRSPGYNAPTVVPETYSLRVETETPSRAWVDLRLRDTSGNDGSECWLIRELEECHVVIVTFDLCDPSSLDNVRSKWVHGIRLLAPKKPVMLVGCRQDLARQQQAERMVHTSSHMSSQDLDTHSRAIVEQREQLTLHARDVRVQIGAADYAETSAWTGEGVDEVVRQAASIALAQEAAPAANYRRSWHLRARSISNSATLLFAP